MQRLFVRPFLLIASNLQKHLGKLLFADIDTFDRAILATGRGLLSLRQRQDWSTNEATS